MHGRVSTAVAGPALFGILSGGCSPPAVPGSVRWVDSPRPAPRIEVMRPKAAASTIDPTESAERAAGDVLRAIHPQLLACYARRLSADPHAHAYLTVDVRIGADGRPRDVATTGGARLGDALDCITARIRDSTFEPPARTGTSRVVVPFAFEPP